MTGSPGTASGTSAETSAAVEERAKLLRAIEWLESTKSQGAAGRVALAEAEFRVAILPDTDPEEAMERIRKAIRHDPLHPKFYFHLGRLLHRSGDPHGAMFEYRQALRLAPGSRRAHLHLALALLELEMEEAKIGREILEGAASGAEHELGELLRELDALLASQLSPEDGSKKKNQEGPKLPPPLRKAGRARPVAGEPAVAAQRVDAAWRLALAEHLSLPKPITRQVENWMKEGERQLDGQTGVADYAIACLFRLLSEESSGRDVDRMLKEGKIGAHADHPAVRLAEAAVSLAQAEKPGEFVSAAKQLLENGRLPLELVCCLHYLKWGPEKSLGAEEALRLLDSYPASFQQTECFRELRLAVLDGYSRRAWNEQRYDRARLLWRECQALDPNRVAIAHNLALVAARTRSREGYGPTWERATELRYLHAAGGGDEQIYLEDRRALHLAQAQQSYQRYCGSRSSPQEQAKEEDLQKWLADRETLDTWLREWDLYYLNSRLRFRSPVHLLGVPRDASEEALLEARDYLLRGIETSLKGLLLAGIQTFCRLAEKAVQKAFEEASDHVQKARDLYYDLEKEEAETVTEEAIPRGFLLLNLIVALAKKPRPGSLQVGCAIARRLFPLPWKVLRPICVNKGKIEAELDLVKVMEGHFLKLASESMQEQPEPAEGKKLEENLAALEECSKILPHRVELHLLRCQLLLAAKRNVDAYSCAVEGLGLLPGSDETSADQEAQAQVRVLQHNLNIMIDNAAFGELPQHVLPPRSVEAAEQLLKEGRKLLKRFPRAGGLRVHLAELMIHLGSVEHTAEAVKVLEAGLKQPWDEEERGKLESLLEKAREQSKVAGVTKQIRTLLENASKRVNEAVEEINRTQTPQALGAARREVAGAIEYAENALKLARGADLSDAAEQAEGLLRQLQEYRRRLGER